jgi:mono/diheme cytochrome c family protein
MQRRSRNLGWIGIGVVWCGCALLAGAEEPKAVERGRDAVRGRPALNPPVWSRQAYDNAWKQWGLAEKPTDYDQAFRQRYGLHQAPYDNHGLPMGLHEAPGLFGKGLVNDCLLCHAGRIAGQTYIGVANASMDVQAIFDDLSAGEAFKFPLPFQVSLVRGTVDPVASVAFLMEMRDPDLNLQKSIKFDYKNDVCSDPPAWWLLKKKKTRGWNGGIDVRSMRVDMAILLSPFNSGVYIKKQEPVFADIHAFVIQVEAPKYPFPIDTQRAEQGRELFRQHCSKCHGSYGPDGSYPNKVVGLDVIGTDPTLAESLLPEKNVEFYNKTWFARELGPDGQPYQFIAHRGYQAPPLDGVWATVPYFHNSSAPTVYHVLNSRARPKVYTRSFQTEKEDYDPVHLGWKTTVLDHSPDASLSGWERRKIYDTTQPGRSNSGHLFGDDLTEDERMAVIEYLKTL